MRSQKPHILKICEDTQSRKKSDPYYGFYLFSVLSLKYVFLRIHRLVAKAFLPNPENKPEVNHKFGKKSDNRAESLEWATRSENMTHRFRVLYPGSRKGENCNWSKLTDEAVRDIRKNCSLRSHKGRQAMAVKYG